MFVVLQGSILRPLLFNIPLCNFFCFLEDFDIASHADDTTNYNTEKNKESVMAFLETSFVMLFKCFDNNFMKVNNE